MALEIQCITNFQGIDLVVKTSDLTQHTYLFLLSENDVEKYWHLSDNLFQSDETSFKYQDEDSELSIDLISTSGYLKSSGPIFHNSNEIQLSNCLKF